jgi:hypothetical protein
VWMAPRNRSDQYRSEELCESEQTRRQNVAWWWAGDNPRGDSPKASGVRHKVRTCLICFLFSKENCR